MPSSTFGKCWCSSATNTLSVANHADANATRAPSFGKCLSTSLQKVSILLVSADAKPRRASLAASTSAGADDDRERIAMTGRRYMARGYKKGGGVDSQVAA